MDVHRKCHRRKGGLIPSPYGTVDKRQLRMRLSGCLRLAPSPVKFTGEGWGEGAGGPAKIATAQDSPSAPVRMCISQRSGNPHAIPLPGQGEGIHKVLARNFT